MLINPLNRESLAKAFSGSKLFPFVVIEGFLQDEFAREVAEAYPSFRRALEEGFSFNYVNERLKVQISDSHRFPEPVRWLNEALASPDFLADLEAITGVQSLLADEELAGGGMHLTGSGGRLDVHVDFNYVKERKLHRRLNLLLYLNPVWEESWGGCVELWDRKVKCCQHSFAPILNRCLIFETSDISYHSAAPVTCPPSVSRKSFATYYYTKEPPPGWDGKSHSTIFRARPEERFRGYVLMPLERFQRRLQAGIRGARRELKRWIVG